MVTLTRRPSTIYTLLPQPEPHLPVYRVTHLVTAIRLFYFGGKQRSLLSGDESDKEHLPNKTQFGFSFGVL